MLLKKIIRKIIHAVFLLLMTISLTVFIKVFLFASYKIPSPSMIPTIIPGDHILVNKLIPGPRIYKSAGLIYGDKTTYSRLKGIRNVQKNDIVVFNFPYPAPDKLEPDLHTFFVKRCLGIPGDTLLIENGQYRVKGYTELLGSKQNQQELAGRQKEDFGSDAFDCFPYDTVYSWTIKDFGPLYIPGKGDRITLDLHNAILYKNLIRYETDLEVSIIDGVTYLGATPCTSYTFRNNYYFMAGDWVLDSQDSRYWGLLPEDLIVGKAIVIWKSKDLISGKFRWDRFFKQLK